MLGAQVESRAERRDAARGRFPSDRADRVARLAPYGVVVAVVVLGNLLYVLGVFDPNPINVTSGLASVVRGGILPGSFTIDPNNGFTSQALGHLAALDLLHGHLPWWNPYEGVGAPLAGEMQAAALFPPTLLVAFSGGQLPFHMLLEAVAGLATYALLLRLGISRWVAVAGGCAFAVSGTFSWFQHAPVNPIPFLPLLLLGVERARSASTEPSPHRWGLIAIALALSVYAGFPETAYLDGLLVALWAGVRAAGLGRTEVLAYARKLGAGLLAGALLAAPILVAFADYLPAADLAGHASGFDGAYLHAPLSAALFFPYEFGPIFGFNAYVASGTQAVPWGAFGGYLTTTLLFFATVSLYARRHRVLRLALVAWIVIAIGRMYGIPPLDHLFDLLPAMSKVAAYRYLPPSVELAFVVLAALGIDDVRRREVRAWFVGLALATSAAVALFAAGEGASLLHDLQAAPHIRSWTLLSIVWGLGIMVAAAVGALVLRRSARVSVLAGLLVLDALAMFVVPQFSAPRQATVDTALVRWIQRHAGTGRFYTLGPFQPNYGSYFRVGEADVNDVPMPENFARYITTHLDTNVNPSIFTGTTTSLPTGPSPLEEFVRNLRSYEAIGVRFLLAAPGGVPTATVRSTGLTEVYAGTVADVYRLPHPEPLYTVVSGSCTLSAEHVGALVARCRGPATVQRRELEMAGWTATANGRAIPVRPSDGIFQSIQLGSGVSDVTFSFVPPHEGEALLALAVGLAALVYSRARHGRRKSGAARRWSPRRLRSGGRGRHDQTAPLSTPSG